MGRHLLKLSDKRKIWDGTFRTPVFWCEKWDGSNRNGKKHGKNGTVSTSGGGGSFGGGSGKCLTDLTKRKNPVK